MLLSMVDVTGTISGPTDFKTEVGESINLLKLTCYVMHQQFNI